jgi:coenzyme F420 hydrogenase subunit alpha
MEASIKCEIPNDAKMLRHILQLANRLHSIALHDILILPDLYLPGTEIKINPFTAEEPVRTVAKRIQRLREIGQTVGQIAGGDCIHPRNTRVGGMYRNCSEQAKTKMYDLAKEGLTLAKPQMDLMIAILRNYQAREHVDVGGMKVALPKTLGYHNQGYLATHAFYGSSSLDECPSWDIDRFKEVRPWDWYMGEMTVDLEEPRYPIGGTTKVGTKVNPQMEACTGIPMYDGQPVEVGPRARLATYKGYDEKGTVGQNIAREMEYTDCLYEMIDCIDALKTNGKVVADFIPDGDGSLGWASNEAPRGTDVHIARVKDWKVQYFSMLVPTTWNFATCSAALTGAPWQLAEVIMRGYDPCVSCATHMIVLDEDNKVVAQKLIQ